MQLMMSLIKKLYANQGIDDDNDDVFRVIYR
jgi:hypothetical protein